jgi:hypothetical protein
MMDETFQYPDQLPRQYSGRHGCALIKKAQPPLLAGIRAGGSTSIAFPGALFRRTQWLHVMEAESP